MKNPGQDKATMDTNALLRGVSTLIQQGNLDAAESLATRIQGSNPDHADACHILGIIKGIRGQYNSACVLIKRAIAINPCKAIFLNNLGYFLHLDGLFEEAHAACVRAIHVNPDLAEAHNTLGAILKDMGSPDKALSACERAIQINPGLAEAHHTRSIILKDIGHLDEALSACEQAIQSKPGLADAHNTHSVILKDMGRLDEALSASDRAIQIKPDFADAHNNRGSLLAALGFLEEALSACDHSLNINNGNAGAFYNRANILGNLMRYSEAENDYRQALELRPDDHIAHSNLVFLLAALAKLPPEKMLEELRLWDRIHGKEGRLHIFSHHKRETSPTRRIRVGYVSPDFRKHPVSYFFEPLLSAHDRARFEIFCYAVHDKSKSDDTTLRIESIAENWRHAADKSDFELARLIHNDNIDILVDLASHTGNNRLKTFTYKPAPVQATYLGFFSGSGLEAMDYWITDEVIHPANTIEESVETIYRLPRCSFCYQPPREAPDVSLRPDAGNQIVFGSFNHLSKLTPEVFETWSIILRKLPASRLLIMDEFLTEQKTRDRILGIFAGHGIPAKQIVLRKRVPFDEYLSTYAEIDIVLDTFPRTGGTTTAEALWMGVPVVTLAGPRYVERISASELSAVGLDNLITNNREDYLHKVLMLAHDFDARDNLRKSLRLIMKYSALCNAGDLAQAMEDAYFSMWKHYQLNTF